MEQLCCRWTRKPSTTRNEQDKKNSKKRTGKGRIDKKAEEPSRNERLDPEQGTSDVARGNKSGV
jgi:hypothetical protein